MSSFRELLSPFFLSLTSPMFLKCIERRRIGKLKNSAYVQLNMTVLHPDASSLEMNVRERFATQNFSQKRYNTSFFITTRERGLSRLLSENS